MPEQETAAHLRPCEIASGPSSFRFIAAVLVLIAAAATFAFAQAPASIKKIFGRHCGLGSDA